MKVFFIILGIVAMGGVIYLAISKKSTSLMRKIALVALVLMILTIIICLFVLFGTDTAVNNGPLFDESMLPQEASPGISAFALIFFLFFFLALFVVVFIFSLREKNKDGKAKKLLIDGWD